MTKRFLCGFLAVWFTIVSSSAFAFLPLVMAAARITAIALETNAGQQLLVAAPIGIGIAFTAMHITRSDGTNSRNDDLYTTSAPRPPSATESAAGFTSGSPSLTPAPTAGAPSTLYLSGSGIKYSSAAAACQDPTTLANMSGWAFSSVPVGGGTCVWYYAPTNIYTTAYSVTPVYDCSAGYSVSGSSCVLSNAAAVPRPVDNICPIVRTGNSYANDPADPDCANGQAPSVITDATGTTTSINDPSGLSFSFHVNGDGSASITTTTPDTATNTTKKRVLILASPASASQPPVVTGVSDTTLSGTGTGASATSIPVTQTVATADPAQTAALQDIAAKEAATAADRTAAETKAAALGLPAAPWDITKILMPKQSDYTFAAPSSSALPSKSACVSFNFPLAGHSVAVDPCSFINVMVPIVDWALVMMGIASGVWQVLDSRRRAG